jgi:hypothetical protein
MSDTNQERFGDRVWEVTKATYSQLQAARHLDDRMSVLHDALKGIALESWKNGIEAGRRRAAQPRQEKPKPKEFQRRPARA